MNMAQTWFVGDDGVPHRIEATGGSAFFEFTRGPWNCCFPKVVHEQTDEPSVRHGSIAEQVLTVVRGAPGMLLVDEVAALLPEVGVKTVAGSLSDLLARGLLCAAGAHGARRYGTPPPAEAPADEPKNMLLPDMSHIPTL